MHLSEVQDSLPDTRYEKFSGLSGVLKSGCIYNPMWVSLDTEGRNLTKIQMKSHLAKLQVFRKDVEGRS